MKTPKKLVTGATVDLQHDGMLVRFDTLRRGLSTGISHGGLDWFRGFYNHRLLTYYAHERDFPGGSVPNYLALSLLRHGMSPTEVSIMITSAEMEWNAYSILRHDDMVIETICTAGVEGTAARAGDPAYYYEKDGNYYGAGTINIFISLNVHLPDGILAKAFLTATEAKAAALQNEGIASIRTGLPATGTGTDGLMIVCDPFGPLRTDAGTHSKLGELLAQGVLNVISYTFEHYPSPWNRFPSLRTPAAIDADVLEQKRQKEDKERPPSTFDDAGLT